MRALHETLKQKAAGGLFASFGSSNTEKFWHNQGRFSWCCWVECALRGAFGRTLRTINLGISGDTSTDLAARYARDAEPLRPAAMLVTVGGNDFMRGNLETLERNLDEIAGRNRALGCVTIFNAYYAPMLDEIQQRRFAEFMAANERAAARNGALLVNRYPRFRAWWEAEPKAYAKLMLDGFHLNPFGHAVFGAEVIRGLELPPPQLPDDLHEPVAAALARLEACAK